MRKKSSIAIISSMMVIGILAFGGTLAWFNSQAFMQNSDTPIEGSVTDKYYDRGTGTENDPFIIKLPRHLYNFAWLQYLGFYNHDTNITNEDRQFYFKLEDNIDMSAIGAIPPIGTETNPFIGNFDGQGYVVSNVTISNDFSDYHYHPSVMNNDQGVGVWNNTDHLQPHVLGFFGVVGYRSGNKSTVYSSAVNEFINTGLTGVNVKTALNDSLVGIAAGLAYDTTPSDANKIFKNIVVDNSKISLPNSAATTYSGTSALTTNVSDYTLVGYTNVESGVVKASKQVYGINIDNKITFNATEDGKTEGWGGSIDMKSVTERLQTIQSRVSLSSFVYHKRYDYHEGVKNNTPVTVQNDNGNTKHTSLVVDTNHEEWGHFNFITDSADDRRDYALLGGGHYETHRYYEYLQNAKISTTGPHYFTATNYQNTSATISDTTNEANASTWLVPSKANGSGTIYTTGRYNNQNRTYYLRYYNNTLSLTTTQNNATTFMRTEVGGKVRFTYNGYYLDYDNGWKMVRITGAPTEPTRPTPPTPPDAPILPPTPVRPKQSEYVKDVDQLINNSTYLIYSGSGSATFSADPSSYGWNLTNTLTNGGSTKIYIDINGTFYYAVGSTSASGNVTFTTNSNNGTTFRIYENNGQYGFYYTTGGGWSTTYFYYLQNNAGTLYIYRTTSNSASNLSYFTFDTEQVLDTSAYNAALAQYETDLATYEAAVEAYEEEMDGYEILYNQYLSAVEVYETVTYPAYEAELATFMTTSAAFEASTHKLTVTGNNSNTEYIDHETGGMNYDEDDVTYFPLSTIDNTSNFNPSDSNTAYVVGGSSLTADTTSYTATVTNVRFSKYYSTSLISSDFNVSTGKFTHVYTINDNLQKTEITNNETDYSKLKNAKDTLGKVMKGQEKTYGLHFMKSTISMDALTTAKYVKVNKEVHRNYQLPVNSIDFHLKEFGYINFIAASYYHNSESDRNDSFFSLYQIERETVAPYDISRILEVKNVYQHASRTKSYSYVYELTDGTNIFYTKPYRMIDSEGNKAWLYDEETDWEPNQYVSALPQGYAKVFNVNRIKKNNVSYSDFIDHVYFFEIPMNDGEFCLGSVEGATGSYLLYLDIGANAAKTNRTIIYEKFTFTNKTYSHPYGVALQPLDGTYQSGGNATITINATIDYSDSVCVEIQPGCTGDYTINRTSNNVALSRADTTHAPPVYVGENITLTGSGDLNPVHKSMESYNVVRMQYYDYLINTDTLSVTTFTDFYTTGNNPAYVSRVVEQNRYSGNAVNDSPTSSYVYDPDSMIGTVYGEDDDLDEILDEIKVYNTSTGIRYDSDVFIDPTEFEIDSDRLSDTMILEISILQNGGDSYNDATTLVMEHDNETSQTETYYTFDNYTIVLTPNSGTIVVKVISYTSSFDMSVYDYEDETTDDEVTVTTVIIINGETVTQTNQVIPNPGV